VLDPFVHMDQMGEVQYAPGEPKGTPWHPHRGFETVTYMIDGRFQHQDSHGGGGMIENGDTQWMTAGSGILHIETPPEEQVMSGGLFHGVQLWVNLPARSKMVGPAYQGIEGAAVTLVASADAGALVRVIAGEVGEHRGPGRRTRRSRCCTRQSHPGCNCNCPGTPPSTHSSMSWRVRDASVAPGGRSTAVSSSCSGRATGLKFAATTTRCRRVVAVVGDAFPLAQKGFRNAPDRRDRVVSAGRVIALVAVPPSAGLLFNWEPTTKAATATTTATTATPAITMRRSRFD
jgi:hypothetical protein